MTTTPSGIIAAHWDIVYTGNEENQLGWYQAEAKESMELIGSCHPSKDSVIIDIGTGLSPLILNLYDQGYLNIVATDISEKALEKHQAKLGPEIAGKISWFADDVTNSILPQNNVRADIWHDRAVFHFLTREEQRTAYLLTLNTVLKPGGYAIIGTFSMQGAKKCSNLDIVNYDAEDLAYTLGDRFELIHYRYVTHHTPSGAERPFTYTIFKKVR